MERGRAGRLFPKHICYELDPWCQAPRSPIVRICLPDPQYVGMSKSEVARVLTVLGVAPPQSHLSRFRCLLHFVLPRQTPPEQLLLQRYSIAERCDTKASFSSLERVQ
jgi:hypothetical protein